MYQTRAFKKVASFLLAFMFATSVYADSIVTGSKPFTFIPGTVISSSQVNADFDYIINQVNTNAAKNGVNSSITALLGLTTPIAPTFGGSSTYIATTVGGTANAITVTATQPTISSYSLSNRNIVFFKATTQNTGAATLDVNTTGTTSIVKSTTNGLIALQAGDILVNSVYQVFYDGTNYILINNPQLFGQQSDFASAAAVDLGLAQSHNVQITGSTTITSFGSSASAALPLYFIKFNGILTLTHDATALLIPGGGNYTTAAGDAMWVEYIGSGNWRVREIMPRNPGLSVGTVNGLTITNNTGTPTTQLDIATTGRSILENTSGATISVGAQTLTLNAATTGANGLDTGALANNTWYYVYLISNGTTTASLLSTSATTPTMPTGYVYKYRIGAQRTGGAATFNRVVQKGNRAQYIPTAGSVTPNWPIMDSSKAGWTSVTVSTFVPTTAVSIRGMAGNGGSGATAQVDVNNVSSTACANASTPSYGCSRIGATNSEQYVYYDIVLSGTTIFWGGSVLTAHGWTDSVNAN